MKKVNDDRIILSGSHITEEACYTVVYLFAATAVSRGDSYLARSALLQYLTPDGFLTLVAQINRGGEEL